MDVRRKVLLDLFAAPSTLLPLVGGVGVLVYSWATGGSSALNWIGLAGILGGVGMAASRLVFGLERITNNAYQYLHTQQRRKQEEALDRLDNQLRRDRDPRTQECLRQLRELYGRFVDDVENDKINRNTHEILEVVEELFRSSVSQLEASYQLWQTSRTLGKEAKEKMLTRRDQVVEEVLATTGHLGTTIEQFFAFTREKNDDNLGRLQQELDEAIRVARRTEQRMASWQHDSMADKSYSTTEFD
ncbi:MAG TPA: hypothetical protein VE890_05070 [Thermoguttaceae bacterium]|nr:hypothetical protein [Thermoguttaceae bacterium]